MDHNLDTSDIQFLEEGKFQFDSTTESQWLKKVKIPKQNLCCISDLTSFIRIPFMLEELSEKYCFAEWTEF